MEFLEGWGGEFNLKNLLWKGHGYFLEQHNKKISCLAGLCDIISTKLLEIPVPEMERAWSMQLDKKV